MTETCPRCGNTTPDGLQRNSLTDHVTPICLACFRVENVQMHERGFIPTQDTWAQPPLFNAERTNQG